SLITPFFKGSDPMYRNMIGASSALAVLALLVGVPATGFAHEDDRLCNVVLDGDGEPVLESDDDEVGHSNSAACPEDKIAAGEVVNTDAGEQTAAAETAPAVTIDPLIVYFDVNQDQLDAGARAEVNAYVAELQANPAKSLSVVGYTDTSGSADLNARLSEARANSVAAALIEAGLPAGMITRGAAGENDLAISTPDGTREANNRRVSVTPTY
ncbi:MAG: OmpA family protein, partial [Pseudomonadota bacterium]